MCINLCVCVCAWGLGLTSSSESEHDKEKILAFLGLSSSVVGGGSRPGLGSRPILGIRPSFGRFMLPLGFLLALVRRPTGGRFVGGVGAWILVICFMRVARLGDWRGVRFSFIRGTVVKLSLIHI